ncbi:globin family protein [Caulobacter endophyticus]|uniref:Hemoglobin YjbI n=1 Tax=Caulobacter endophyticus TaxID=2172652 RepID=A0A2T9K7J0_9CAUL|nr:hypothetical protein [Caulobacter endophyticus]PVM91843.1 hypothetical protein DDF67_06290 [Caulobacter endophyticus]
MSAYERIGGEAAAQSVIDDFFQRAQGDERLAGLFGGEIPPGARAVVAGALDPEAGEARGDLELAQVWFGANALEDDELDLIIGHLAAALEAAGISDEIAADVADQIELLRDLALGPDEEDFDDEDEDEEGEVAA